jgi:hypothetical protein
VPRESIAEFHPSDIADGRTFEALNFAHKTAHKPKFIRHSGARNASDVSKFKHYQPFLVRSTMKSWRVTVSMSTADCIVENYLHQLRQAFSIWVATVLAVMVIR